MLSNKLTFSLASLVVLITLGLVFATVPVMAHDGNETHDANATGHVQVKSITLDRTYLTATPLERIVATITFELTQAAVPAAVGPPVVAAVHEIVLPTTDVTVVAAGVDSDGGPVTTGVTVGAVTEITAPTAVGVTPAVAGVYRVVITRDAGTEDGVYTIRVGSATATDIDYYGNVTPAAQQKTFTVDGTPPMVAITTKVATGGTFEEGTEDDPLTAPFIAVVTLTEDNPPPASGVKITATPTTATVGTVSRTASKVYEALVTPDTTMDSLTLTVEVSDMAGNMATGDTTMAGPYTVKKTESTTRRAVPTSTITSVYDGATDTVELTGKIKANGFTIIGSANLPDLNAFFIEGGTISLVAASGTEYDVVISEINWGLDLRRPVAMQAEQQFIELYNTTRAEITLTGATLRFDRSAVVPGAPTGMVILDQVSNVYLAGWVVDIGQSGRLRPADLADTVDFTPTDIISMYRNIDYVKVEKEPAGTTITEAERTAQLKDFPDGKVKGSWQAATKLSATNIVSTPNMKHVVSVSVLTPTVVPYSPVIINEIGNLSGDTNDWIELKAVADVNLKNYELSVIKDGVITVLVHIPNDKGDYNLVADDLLLIVNKDPRTTPLARGKKFGDANGTTPDEDQENRGVSHDISMFYDAAGGLNAMPEDDDFLLVLRSEPKDNHEKIIDLVGTDFHADPSDAYRTNLFPLQGTGVGHDNVIDEGGDDEFDAPGAYKRNDAAGGTGEKDWSPAGYTGIGYIRSAATGDPSGGTPGFPNDALKEKGLASDTITISEVMVNTRGGRYPQWIELRNSSDTEGVNLNGWKLRVDNAGQDVDTRQRYTLDLSGHIPPNRAILIVARITNTRSDIISESQLINLNNTDNKKTLEADGSRFAFLSTEGFTLELFEKDQKTSESPVDMIEVMAEQLTEEMIGDSTQRISLIRAYESKSPGNLISADASEQIANDGSYYGATNDIGTPGNYPGGALPVELSTFRPLRDKATGAVVIRWATESELDNAGFNILRSETKTGEFKVVNLKGIIPGHGTTSEKHVYEWKDTTAKPNVVYYYQIEDVSLDGNRTTLATTHLRGNVTAAGKATTRWGELKDSRY